jgi:hypothetical protein
MVELVVICTVINVLLNAGILYMNICNYSLNYMNFKGRAIKKFYTEGTDG